MKRESMHLMLLLLKKSDKQEGAYQELTDDIICDMKEKFSCFFEKFISDNGTCSLNEPIC